MTDSPTGLEQALHIRLVCWDCKHVQAISPEQLRQLVVAPVCIAPAEQDICGSPIWAVEHEGEPTRYVGRPPHRRWEAWAECIQPSTSGDSEAT